MNTSKNFAPAVLMAAILTACGGGGGSDLAPTTGTAVSTQPSPGESANAAPAPAPSGASVQNATTNATGAPAVASQNPSLPTSGNSQVAAPGQTPTQASTVAPASQAQPRATETVGQILTRWSHLPISVIELAQQYPTPAASGGKPMTVQLGSGFNLTAGSGQTVAAIGIETAGEYLTSFYVNSAYISQPVYLPTEREGDGVIAPPVPATYQFLEDRFCLVFSRNMLCELKDGRFSFYWASFTGGGSYYSQ